MTHEYHCHACSGPGVLVGGLGKLLHFRCRNCGMIFSVPRKEQS